MKYNPPDPVYHVRLHPILPMIGKRLSHGKFIKGETWLLFRQKLQNAIVNTSTGN